MGRTLQSGKPPVRDFSIIVPPEKGGTGGTTVLEAQRTLGGLSRAKLGLMNGLARLDSNSKLPVNNIPKMVVKGSTLKGPSTVSISQTVTYTISNYDTNTTYSVSASAGTVALSGDTISFTAPATAQNVTLTINGRSVNIPVSAAKPIKPLLTGKSFGAGGVASLALTGTAFSMTSGTGVQKSADWEVSTTPDFANNVFSSSDDTVNLTTINVPNLAYGNTYYARCRYRDSNNIVGLYSSTLSITTKTSYILNSEEAKLVATDKAANDNFGVSTAITSDGTRVVIGAHAADVGAVDTGAAYVFVNDGTSWKQEAKLSASDRLAGDLFAVSASINSDGSRIAIGATASDPTGVVNAGAVYIYVRTGTTWTQEAKLTATDKVAGDFFGSAVALNSDSSRIVIGASSADVGAVDTGAAYIFTRSGSMWTQEAKLTASDRAAGDLFGRFASINSDATRVAVSSYLSDSGGIVNSGGVYIFSRSGTVWTQEAKITASDKAVNDNFGISISLDSTATRIAIGSQFTDVTTTDTGAVYVFSRSGTVWTQEAKLTASDKLVNDQLGNSVSLNSNGTRLIVGASNSDAGSVDSGSAYVFTRIGTTWSFENKITASDKSSGDNFGYSVSLAADSTKAVISSLNVDIYSLTNTGAAYIVAVS